MTTATLLEKPSVRAFIYYGVMICNGSGIAYLMYLCTVGSLG